MPQVARPVVPPPRLFPLAPLSAAVLLALSPSAVLAQAPETPSYLAPVVVTASGFEQSMSEAPASITVITREELLEKQASSVAEALADVPGVDVRANTGKTGGQNISIRGMPSSYTLILVDGRRQNVSGDVTPNGFGETATSFMPPMSAIERIEVIRGPMSTLYGSDAIGGVINIITRPVSDTWSGTLTVDGTLNQDKDAGDTRSVSLFATGPLVADRLGVQLRGRVFDRGESERLIKDATGRDPRPTEGRIYSLGGRLTLTATPTDSFWVDAEQGRQRYDNSDGRLGNLDTPTRIYGYKDELEFNRDQIAVGHRGRYDLGTWENSVSYIKTETLGRTLPPGSAPDYGYEAVGGEDRILENRELVFDTKFSLPLEEHMFTLGGQFIDAELEDGAAGDATFAQQSWAVFLEDEWWMRDNLALTLGARYENHEAFGGHVSPRAYLVWNTTDRLTLKGGVSQGYKTPTLNDLHDGITGFTAQGQTVTIGSPELEPERSTNYELGVLYDTGALSFGATVFYNDFKDRIADGDPIPNCQYEDQFGNTPNAGLPGCISIGNFTSQENFAQLVNIDRAETRGLELTARYRFAPAWELSGTYTYTDTEITSGEQRGQLLTNTPEHVVTGRLRWNITPRFSAWLDGEYNSSRERFTGGAPTSGQNLSLYQQVGNKLDGYELFHLGATYRVKDNFRLTAVIYNLLDKDFGEAIPYQHGGDTYYAYRYTQTGRSTDGFYMDRRHLWLSAVYEF